VDKAGLDGDTRRTAAATNELCRETNHRITDLEATVLAGFEQNKREFKAIRKELIGVVYHPEFEDLAGRVKELQDLLAMPQKKAA
jgi:hypothetical protein